MYTRFVGRPKKVAVIKRWLYYRSGGKAGFHCTKKYSAQNKDIRILALHVMLGNFFWTELFVSVTRNASFFTFLIKITQELLRTEGILNLSRCGSHGTNTNRFCYSTSGFIKKTFSVCLYQREKHGGQILRLSRYYSKPNFCWKNLRNYKVIRRFHTHDKLNFLVWFFCCFYVADWSQRNRYLTRFEFNKL